MSALRRTYGVAVTAGVAAMALLLGACGSKSNGSDNTGGNGGTTPATGGGSATSSAGGGAANFKACMVTDTGGVRGVG